MGADIGALVTLDTGLVVPGGHGDGHAALLVGGSALLEGAVHAVDELGDGQGVAVHLVDGLHDVLHLSHQLSLALVVVGNGSVLGGSPVGGHVHLDEGGSAQVDGLVVHVNHVLALLQVGLGGSFLHVADAVLLGHDVGQSEEGGLENGVGALAHTNLDGQVDGVDHVQLDVVLSDVALGSGIQVVIELVEVPLAVDQEHAAGLDVTDDGEALGDVAGHVAGHEVSLVDVVGAADSLITEAQVGDGHAASLLGVVLEVSLHVLVGVVADDLDGVLVGAHGTVAAQTPELALDGALGSRVGRGLLLQGQVSHVVLDAQSEQTLGLSLGQLLIHSEHAGGGSILGAQTVTTTDDIDVGAAAVGQSGDNIQVQRLALSAGLLGAVQHSDVLAGGGDGSQQLVGTERTIQTHLHQTHLLAVSVQVVDDFLSHVADGAHGDDDAVSVGSAVVVEQLVVGAQLLIDLAHVLLDDLGDSVIVGVGGLTVLEEDVAVLVRTAHHGVIGVEGAGAERSHGVHVAHLSQILVIPHGNLLDLVRGTEAVEEVDEGDTALQGSQVSHSRQVHDLLGVGLTQHGKAGLTASHNVGVIAKDVQSMAGHSTGGDMEHGGQQLTGNLVHVGDHQKQTLGCGVGGGQGASGQRAVDGTGSTSLGLHLHNLHGLAEDVLPASSGPLIHIVSHGAGRSDGVNTRNLCECVGHVSGSGVAVHSFELTCHFRFLLLFLSKER